MTAERPQLGTVMSVASGVTNIALDALFIPVFGWGIAGAAIASMLGCAVGGFFPVWWFASKRNNSRLRLNLFHATMPDRLRVIRRTCTNGLSEYVSNIAFNIVGICYNLQLMRYIGENGVAAYGVLLYLSFILVAVFIGYNLTLSPVVGFNYGAQNHAELTSLLRHSTILLFACGFLLTAVAEVGTPWLARAFVSYDADLLALTERALRLYMISFFVAGFNMFVSAWFTGLNNGIVSATASFARTLVFELGAVFVLPWLWGIDGIWLAVDMADGMALILSVTLLLAFRKRYGYRFLSFRQKP